MKEKGQNRKGICLLLMICVMGISSCEKSDYESVKNEFQQNNSSAILNDIRVSVSHQRLGEETSTWLIFNAKEDYFALLEMFEDATELELNNFEDMLGFSSMRSTMAEESRDSIGFDDDVLATLVNESGQIQIGDSLFTINIVDGYVTIHNLIDDNQSAISIDEEVYYEEDEEPVVVATEKNGDESEDEILSSIWKLPSSVNFGDDSVTCKVKYCRAAIYFSLKATMKERLNLSSGGCYSSKNLYVYPGSYTKNKRNASQTLFSDYSIGGLDRTYKHTVYSGFKGLKQFNLSAEFSVEQYPPFDDAVVMLSIHR